MFDEGQEAKQLSKMIDDGNAHYSEDVTANARMGTATIIVTDVFCDWGSRSGGTRYNLDYFLQSNRWTKAKVINVTERAGKDAACNGLLKAVR